MTLGRRAEPLQARPGGKAPGAARGPGQDRRDNHRRKRQHKLRGFSLVPWGRCRHAYLDFSFVCYSEAPYAALAGLAERRWEEVADTGVEVVPTAIAGWNPRPRVENPVPWEAWQRPGAGMDRFYHTGSAEEIAAHLRRCVDWVAAQPEVSPAGAALAYAWNENDEGGWLVPTLPFDDRRRTAVRRALAR